MDDCLSITLMQITNMHVTTLLRPYLGDVGASRLADQIAQSLVDGRADPQSLAHSLPPGVPAEARRRITATLGALWAGGARRAA